MKLSKLLSPNDAKPLEPNISNVAPKDSKMMKRIILIGNLSIQVLFLEIALVYLKSATKLFSVLLASKRPL
ncbi:hypothetical protein, partial [Phocaeicola vulgatus]|uniref:hypothetical protein n=1 Tax=Phocaeicola vulgatus TaxID=821 RepID=UPI001C70199B